MRSRVRQGKITRYTEKCCDTVPSRVTPAHASSYSSRLAGRRRRRRRCVCLLAYRSRRPSLRRCHVYILQLLLLLLLLLLGLGRWCLRLSKRLPLQRQGLAYDLLLLLCRRGRRRLLLLLLQRARRGSSSRGQAEVKQKQMAAGLQKQQQRLHPRHAACPCPGHAAPAAPPRRPPLAAGARRVWR